MIIFHFYLHLSTYLTIYSYWATPTNTTLIPQPHRCSTKAGGVY